MLNRLACIPTILVLWVAAPLFAVDLKSLKPEGYVSDFARVVDSDSNSQVSSYARTVEDKTGVQMSFVTLDTLDGESLEDVSIDLFRQFGVGHKGKDDGVQLLLVTGDHRSRLEVGNGLEPVLPDGFDGQILVSMRPELQAGHYGQALLAAAHQIGAAVAQAQGVSIPAAALPPAVAHPTHDVSPPWLLIIFLALIPIYFVGRIYRARRAGGGFWPGPSYLSSSPPLPIYPSSIGGGFGGTDIGASGGFGDAAAIGGDNSGSGGDSGFSGFGGGDAGGGGASSDW